MKLIKEIAGQDLRLTKKTRAAGKMWDTLEYIIDGAGWGYHFAVIEISEDDGEFLEKAFAQGWKKKS